MADFKAALKKTLQHEGGYVNDPVDTGGETYRGVARNKNPSWPGWKIVDALRKQPGFPRNLDASAELQAAIEAIYKAEYWDRIGGDAIRSQAAAESLFDTAVNMGVARALQLGGKAAGLEGTPTRDTLVAALNSTSGGGTATA